MEPDELKRESRKLAKSLLIAKKKKKKKRGSDSDSSESEDEESSEESKDSGSSSCNSEVEEGSLRARESIKSDIPFDYADLKRTKRQITEQMKLLDKGKITKGGSDE